MWQRREDDEAIASAVPFAMHRQEINKQTTSKTGPGWE